MMKQQFFLWFFLLNSVVGVCQNFYSPCKDPNKIENIYYPCYDDYTPVCGCDGVTYRSRCSAEDQHALNTGNWVDGPCSDFHYVIEPNLISYALQVKMYKKKAGYINIIIYDAYGHVFFQASYALQSGRTDREINETASFEHGLYILEIDSDGDKQVKKFFKAKTD